MTTTEGLEDCEYDVCESCHTPTVDTDQNGLCFICADLGRRLALMSRGVTRNPQTGLHTIATTKG